MTTTPFDALAFKLTKPAVFDKERDFLVESSSQSKLEGAVGSSVQMPQDDHSRSVKSFLPGLCYQFQQAQREPVPVAQGKIFDVTLYLKKSNRILRLRITETLSATNRPQRWLQKCLAHDRVGLTENASLLCKNANHYPPTQGRRVLWNDATLDIDWPHKIAPAPSTKGSQGNPFVE